MDKHWERPDPVALGVIWGLAAAVILAVYLATGGFAGITGPATGAADKPIGAFVAAHVCRNEPHGQTCEWFRTAWPERETCAQAGARVMAHRPEKAPAGHVRGLVCFDGRDRTYEWHEATNVEKVECRPGDWNPFSPPEEMSAACWDSMLIRDHIPAAD